MTKPKPKNSSLDPRKVKKITRAIETVVIPAVAVISESKKHAVTENTITAAAEIVRLTPNAIMPYTPPAADLKSIQTNRQIGLFPDLKLLTPNYIHRLVVAAGSLMLAGVVFYYLKNYRKETVLPATENPETVSEPNAREIAMPTETVGIPPDPIINALTQFQETPAPTTTVAAEKTNYLKPAIISLLGVGFLCIAYKFYQIKKAKKSGESNANTAREENLDDFDDCNTEKTATHPQAGIMPDRFSRFGFSGSSGCPKQEKTDEFVLA